MFERIKKWFISRQKNFQIYFSWQYEEEKLQKWSFPLTREKAEKFFLEEINDSSDYVGAKVQIIDLKTRQTIKEGFVK